MRAGYPKASKPSIRALKAIINCGAGRLPDTALEASGVAQLCNASRRSLVVDSTGTGAALYLLARHPSHSGFEEEEEEGIDVCA